MARFFSRVLRFTAAAALAAAPALIAQGTISGTVTNKTTGKLSAGDTVTLIRLQQGMQESTVTHTDARGRYTIQLPDGGIHLVRVTHDRANYFGAAPPGVSTVDVNVFNAAPKVEGVSTQVQELHVEGTANELHIVEVLEVQNQSAPPRTQFGPNGFGFYLPEGARVERTGAVTDGGMPVPAAAAPIPRDPGHYSFLFPVRPGETQFGIFYSLPYTGSVRLPIKVAEQVHTLAIVLPKGMKLTPGPATPWALSPASTDGSQTWLAQNVSPSQPLDVTLSGTGTLPQKGDTAAGANGQAEAPADANANSRVDANGNPDPTKFGGGLGKPVDPEADRYPLAKYKWWILGGLALLLATAAGILLRRPGTPDEPTADAPIPPPQPYTGPAAYTAVGAPSPMSLQTIFKEELYVLETEHLQGRLSDEEYARIKQALGVVMQRALARAEAASARVAV